MFLLQANWEVVGKLIDRYGLALVFLVIVLLAFWKGLWPWIKGQLVQADNDRKATQQVLTTQLERAEKRIEKADQAHENLVKRVTEALEEQNRFNRRLVEGMDQVLERTKRL